MCKVENMVERQYYSLRAGLNNCDAKIDLPILLRLFRDMYLSLEEKGYFQEAFGYYCNYDDDTAGTLGYDIGAQMFKIFRRDNLWPIQDKCSEYSKADLFDVIEFIYDYISKPIKKCSCGIHYEIFNQAEGRQEYLSQINDLIKDFETGFELSENGEILAAIDSGFSELIEEHIIEYDAENVDAKISAAVLKFRRYRSSQDEIRGAVRDLAEVLEFIRPKIKKVLDKRDENDLFNIVNNFGIRHHNDQQKTDYDRSVWNNWMFYYYLATIHAILKLIEKKDNKG
jgi:hypothetical protein